MTQDFGLSRRAALWGLPALLAGCATIPAPTVALSPVDETAVTQVQDYLNELDHFTARFGQTSQSGYADGYIWLQRPGRMRVEYVTPSPKLLLANRGWLLMADRVSGSTTTLPLSKTPLDILLSPHIVLSGAVTVTSVVRNAGQGVQISLTKTANPGQGSLTLQFADQPLALSGVTLTDRNGQQTFLSLTGLNRITPIDPARFVYNAPQS